MIARRVRLSLGISKENHRDGNKITICFQIIIVFTESSDLASAINKFKRFNYYTERLYDFTE